MERIISLQVITLVLWTTFLMRTDHVNGHGSDLPQQSPLFYENCYEPQSLNIPIENGYIDVHCVLTEHQFQTQVFQQIFNNDARIHITHIVGIWRRTVEFLNRDGRALICTIQCDRGKPYPRLDRSAQYEPAQVNVGCADVAALRCEDACDSSIHNVPNGFITCTEDVFVGSVCSLECDDGYKQIGPVSRTCKRQGVTWSPQEEFKCEKPPSCRTLPSTLNGEIRCSMGNKVLSRCTLYCNQGYHQEDSINTVWCLGDQGEPQWVWVDKRQVSKNFGNNSFSCKAIHPTPDETSTVSLEGSEIALKRYSVCSPSPFGRQRCGNYRTNRVTCREMRCCWQYDARKSRAFACYKPMFKSHYSEISKIDKSSVRGGESKLAVPMKAVPSRDPVDSKFGGERFSERSSDGYKPKSMDHKYTGPSGLDGLNEAYESVFPLPVATGRCGCDKDQGDNDPIGKITGGSGADIAQYPWQALVYYNNHMCGASLIADQYAVTAAHCLRPTNGALDTDLGNYVFFGVTNLTNGAQNKQMQRLSISEIIRHPNFTERAQGYAMNDLAIVKLAKTVNISGKTATPICLPGNRPKDEFTDCRVSGYGKDGSNNVQQFNLHAANVDIITRTSCEKYYPKYALRNATLCAGSKPPHAADTCEGDSGGPLACRSRDNENCSWHLVGITSFGREPCGKAPSVFVDVASYEQWIRETIYKLHNHIHNPDLRTP